jgi:hypothetical protein
VERKDFRQSDTAAELDRPVTAVSALELTPRQAAAIERLYQESLPTRQHASEDVIGLTEDIATRLRDGRYDGELLHATERLAGARVTQCELRRHAFERSVQVLTARQRRVLTRLIAAQRIAE